MGVAEWFLVGIACFAFGWWTGIIRFNRSKRKK